MDATIHRVTRVQTVRESYRQDGSDDILHDFHVLNLIVETEDGHETIRMFSKDRIEIEEGK